MITGAVSGGKMKRQRERERERERERGREGEEHVRFFLLLLFFLRLDGTDSEVGLGK